MKIKIIKQCCAQWRIKSSEHLSCSGRHFEVGEVHQVLDIYRIGNFFELPGATIGIPEHVYLIPKNCAVVL